MKKNLVLINIPANEALQTRMREAAPDWNFVFYHYHDDCSADYARAQVAFGRFYPHKLPYPANMKWIQAPSAGVERLLDAGALPPDAMITCATGSYGVTISEFMLGQTLTLFYHLHLYRDLQRANKWSRVGFPSTIEGKTVLMLGLGDIGSNYTRRMRAMGAYTIGVRRSDTNKPDDVDELYTMNDPALCAQFARADIVAMCLPNTPETQGFLSAERIAMLKPGCIVVNAGRGCTVDEPSLIVALQQGRIAGVALDVFETEPLPTDSPLWNMANVFLTPHIAGHDFAPPVLDKTVELFFYNLSAFREGRPLRCVVDKETSYAHK